jgi:hypothetical protein
MEQKKIYKDGERPTSLRYDMYSITEYKPACPEFIDRMSVIYGETKTGKTRTIKTILNGIKDEIITIFLFSTTEAQNESFKGIIPHAAIFNELNYENINPIIERQEGLVKLYRKTCDIDLLKRLYRRHTDKQIDEMIAQEAKVFQRKMREIDGIVDSNIRESRRQELEMSCEDRMRQIYKGAIQQHLGRYKAISGSLTMPEKACLAHIFDRPPRCVIIIDDCGVHMRAMFNMKKFPNFTGLFYQGRHWMITTIIATQARTDLPPNGRSNVHNTLFTSNQAMLTFFGPGSGTSKTFIKFAEKISSTFFDMDRKMVFFKDETQMENRVRFIHPITPRIQLYGSKAFVKFCIEAERQMKENDDDDNPYYQQAIRNIQ